MQDDSDGTERASVLVAYLASAFTNGRASVQSLTCAAPTELHTLDCGVEEVRNLLASLEGPKPAGPDGLHSLILKTLADTISLPVTDLFHGSLFEVALPSNWKRSAVKLFPKGGDPSKADKYRLICLTYVFAKILEKEGLL